MSCFGRETCLAAPGSVYRWIPLCKSLEVKNMCFMFCFCYLCFFKARLMVLEAWLIFLFFLLLFTGNTNVTNSFASKKNLRKWGKSSTQEKTMVMNCAADLKVLWHCCFKYQLVCCKLNWCVVLHKTGILLIYIHRTAYTKTPKAMSPYV